MALMSDKQETKNYTYETRYDTDRFKALVEIARLAHLITKAVAEETPHHQRIHQKVNNYALKINAELLQLQSFDVDE